MKISLLKYLLQDPLDQLFYLFTRKNLQKANSYLMEGKSVRNNVTLNIYGNQCIDGTFIYLGKIICS